MAIPKNADGSLSIGPTAMAPSYFATEPISGPSGGGPSGTDKSMLSILNPSSSGKRLMVRLFSVQAESSSGTNVIVLYELRRITAHTGGTSVTPKKRDSNDAASVAEVKKEPSSVTGTDNHQSFIIQSNTAQGPYSYVLRLGISGEKPLVLNEGEGLVVHQVTGNGGTFHINVVWTEE